MTARLASAAHFTAVTARAVARVGIVLTYRAIPLIHLAMRVLGP